MRRTAPYRFCFMASAALTVMLSGGFPGIAYAQITSREGIALQDQIQQLNQQVSQLQASGAGNAMAAPSNVPVSGASNGDLTAQLLDRVSTLESQNREMRGQLDQLTNQVQQQNAALSKQVSDMQFAAQNGGGAPASSAGSDSAGPSAAPAALPTAKPKTALELLQVGQAALHGGDYSSAQTDAQQALKSAKTPQGKMDSQFLLAQSLAGQKQYRDSAVAYYDAYNRLPHSPRAPEALLGVSASMLALGDKSSACEALGKLHSEFPQPTPRVKAAAASFKARAACH